MNRHYYISDNLDDLETVEQELAQSGISLEQMHVLSDQDAELKDHRLHQVPSMMKQDVVHWGKVGLLIGAMLAVLVLVVGYFSGWTQTAAGWIPVLFLAAVLMGFSLWEGSFVGLQRPSGDVRRFEPSLHAGQHVFFVDVKPEQEPVLDMVVRHHPRLEIAGFGAAMPSWLVSVEHAWNRFRHMM
ncbi:magnesium transporter [Pseudomonas sp. LA21]|uniref:magnesium transporter n=1 Tax=unclassified Pseudomonas TaxID=196821 RepID=UPI001A9F9664|nr:MULTISPECIES: magnesium transporter [unclassified Pseudomonas]MCJ1888181.1 magnesium transporter [Pseudomonas sp. LA21]